MNIARWLMAAAVGVLTCSWAMAGTVPPPNGHYLIDVEGWDPFQDFNFIPNPVLPPPQDLSPCLPAGNFCGDASIRIDNGGGSTPENGSFTFGAGPTGSATLFFENTGPAFTAAEISTILNPDEFNDPFTCIGGAIFQNCGFQLIISGQTETLNTFFYNPFSASGVPTVAPEPSQLAVLLFACAAVIVARIRKKSVSSSFVQTPR